MHKASLAETSIVSKSYPYPDPSLRQGNGQDGIAMNVNHFRLSFAPTISKWRQALHNPTHKISWQVDDLCSYSEESESLWRKSAWTRWWQGRWSQWACKGWQATANSGATGAQRTELLLLWFQPSKSPLLCAVTYLWIFPPGLVWLICNSCMSKFWKILFWRLETVLLIILTSIQYSITFCI